MCIHKGSVNGWYSKIEWNQRKMLNLSRRLVVMDQFDDVIANTMKTKIIVNDSDANNINL